MKRNRRRGVRGNYVNNVDVDQESATMPNRRVVKMLGLQWQELLDTLPPQAIGVYYTLLSIARGRKMFEQPSEELIPLFANMSHARFNALVQKLVDYDLISVRELPKTTRWLILREPEGWQPKATDENFLRRVVN